MNDLKKLAVKSTVLLAIWTTAMGADLDPKPAIQSLDLVSIQESIRASTEQLQASAASRARASEELAMNRAARDSFDRTADVVISGLDKVSVNADQLSIQRMEDAELARAADKALRDIYWEQRLQVSQNLAAQNRGWLSSVGGFVKRWGYKRPVGAAEMLGGGFERFGWQAASVPQAFFTGDFDRLSHMNPITILTLNLPAATQDLGGTTFRAAVAVVPLQRVFGDFIDEAPNEIAPNECPVYYIQGAGCSKKDADGIAAALSKRLGVKVCVIDQETAGKPLDICRGGGSRAFPLLGLIGAEPATRKILWVIRNQPRATFIAHSFGNLLTRDAIIAGATLGYGPKIQNSIAWVVLAPPLVDSLEVPVKPAGYHRLVNPGDRWSQVLRPQGWPLREGNANGNGHDAQEYVNDVQPEWLMR